ncbi:MAG TPA: GNAT family N-acetyltransferase [Bacteroidales bacterium]|nr:GNAT family N-acetyltransferase [Bacteroidales bacterium]
MTVNYAIEKNLDADEFLQILFDSGLAERRPVHDKERITSMLKNSNLIVTARVDNRLVGIARSVTDFVYSTYLSDLAVSKDLQKLNIGKELIRQTKRASMQAKLILLSAPAAIEYYPKIGMKQHMACFFLDNIEDLA